MYHVIIYIHISFIIYHLSCIHIYICMYIHTYWVFHAYEYSWFIRWIYTYRISLWCSKMAGTSETSMGFRRCTSHVWRNTGGLPKMKTVWLVVIDISTLWVFGAMSGGWFCCHLDYFPIYWVYNHPNWLIFFRGVQTNNQNLVGFWSYVFLSTLVIVWVGLNSPLCCFCVLEIVCTMTKHRVEANS